MIRLWLNRELYQSECSNENIPHCRWKLWLWLISIWCINWKETYPVIVECKRIVFIKTFVAKSTTSHPTISDGGKSHIKDSEPQTLSCVNISKKVSIPMYCRWM